VPYGLFFMVNLDCLGLCLDKWSICMLIGGLLAAFRVRLCGRWCFCDFCSVYGRKEMIKKIKDCERTLEEIKSLFFNTLYL
jgi:hypothetical protein